MRALDGDVDDPVLVGPKTTCAAASRSSCRSRRSPARVADHVVRALDEVVTALGPHLVVASSGMWPSSMARAEVVVGLAHGREADLVLLVARLHAQLEHAQLALGVHRVDQRLVPVTQVDSPPARGLSIRSSATCGPGPRRGSARGTGCTSGTAFPTSLGVDHLCTLFVCVSLVCGRTRKLRDEEGRDGLVAAERQEAHRSHDFTVCRVLGSRPPLGTAARMMRQPSRQRISKPSGRSVAMLPRVPGGSVTP